MKMKKKIGITLLIGLFMISGCDNEKPEASNTTNSTVESIAKAEEIEVSFSFVKDEKEYKNETLTLSKDSDLMTGLKENFEVVEEGGMIQGIDGLMQDEKESYYWTYTINDEMVSTGASDTILNTNDKVVFTYAKF